MHVLAGDLGGTKTLLAIAEAEPGELRIIDERRYESRAYDGLLPMIQEFLAAAYVSPENVRAACFGIAGPVTETVDGQSAEVTNLPWVVDSTRLARALGIAKLRLINDFQAVGYGIEAMTERDLVALQEGTAVARAPRAVIGAGTGLGQGILVWYGSHYEVLATEGGHVDFGPTDAVQIELLKYLLERYNRVSYERVVSGSGLVAIYAFLRDRRGVPESATVAEAMTRTDPAAAITEAALAGSDMLATQALDLFVRVYGAQAGNLALTCLSKGGVYVAGGIAPKILPKLKEGPFVESFLKKGRMSPLLAAMPVSVITNPKVGLVGAVMAAGRL